MLTRGQARGGFTLIELLVVLTVISLLIGLLLPAVQAARQAAVRASCQSSLHQLGVAVHGFCDANGSMPSYSGVYPPSGASTYPSRPQDQQKMFGSWFAHLLPYVEQNNVYERAMSDIQASGWNQQHWDAPPSYTAQGVVVEHYNGHDYVTQQYTIAGGTGLHSDGIWINGVHDATYPLLQCRADPTAPSSAKVYSSWGYSNYLANYNAWTSSPAYGAWAPPMRLAAMTDGLSSTILFGEGYASCDGVGRIALYSWYYHNFALNWYQQANTLMFQDHPPVEKCDNWRAQSGHSGGMNVCLADGSVRMVPAGIAQATWTALLLPADGTSIGPDW